MDDHVHRWFRDCVVIIGACAIAFLLGSVMLLPLWDKRTGLDVITSYFSSDDREVAPVAASENLDVDGFTEAYIEWTETGSSPYLDADDSTNYIETSTDEADEAWFTFEDTIATGTLVVQMYVDFDAGDGNDDCNWFIDTNGDDTEEFSGKFDNPTTAVVNTGNISGLDSVEEVDAARVRFQKITIGGAANMRIDHAYLYVIYEEPVLEWHQLQDYNITLQNISGLSWNTIQDWNTTLHNTSIEGWTLLQTWNISLRNISDEVTVSFTQFNDLNCKMYHRYATGGSNQENWETACDATSAYDFPDYTQVNMLNAQNTYIVQRGFLVFNTSSIPDTATITGVALNFTVSTTWTAGNYFVMDSNSGTTIEKTDFDRTKFGAFYLNQAWGNSLGGYNVSFNQNVSSSIVKDGYTCLVVRFGWDVNRTYPTDTSCGFMIDDEDNIKLWVTYSSVEEEGWQQLQNWNITLQNISGLDWNTIQEWNTTIQNGTVNWGDLETWNITLQNISGLSWDVLQDWNLTIQNLSGLSWKNLQDWNITISNTLIFQQLQDYNITLQNGTLPLKTLQDWNITLTNGTLSWGQLQEYNITLQNTSITDWTPVQNWNITISNASSFQEMLDYNITLQNLSLTWNINQEYNITLQNLNSWYNQQDWNITLRNSAAFTPVSEMNITIRNSSSANQIQDINITLSNSNQWNQLDNWNITLRNSSIDEWTVIQTWNITIKNGTGQAPCLLYTWNITLVNSSIMEGNITITFASPNNTTVPVNTILLKVGTQQSNGYPMNITWSWNNSGVWIMLANQTGVYNGTYGYYPVGVFSFTNTSYMWRIHVNSTGSANVTQNMTFNTSGSITTGGIPMNRVGVAGIFGIFGFAMIFLFLYRRKRRDDYDDY